MAERTTEASPLLKARIAGVFYLLIFVTAPFHELYVRGKLVVYGDAAATAANIMAHESLYRSGFSVALVTLLCDVAVALILYELLKPVSRSLSLFAAAFRLIFVGIMAVNALNYYAPLILLNDTSGQTAFKVDQLQALALFSARLYNAGFNIADVFFGIHICLIGYLIFRSTFLPRILGTLLAAGGLAYVIVSFANFLAPGNPLGVILWLGAVAELSLTLWLLVMGLNVQRWKEQSV
jgi:hypothetical protein